MIKNGTLSLIHAITKMDQMNKWIKLKNNQN
jgi:hypothetical protein